MQYTVTCKHGYTYVGENVQECRLATKMIYVFTKKKSNINTYTCTTSTLAARTALEERGKLQNFNF